MNSEAGSGSPSPQGPLISIPRGVWLLGRGDAAGLNCFRSGTDAVLSAMAPSLALFLVVVCLQILQGPSARDITKVMLLLTALLVRLVVTQAFAAHWSRQGLWSRYVVASLWSDWLPPVLSLIAGVLLHAVAPAVADTKGATLGVLIVIEAYDLWLSWFVARAGLVLRWFQAALLVFVVLLVTILLYTVAAWLPPYYNLWTELTTPMFHR